MYCPAEVPAPYMRMGSFARGGGEGTGNASGIGRPRTLNNVQNAVTKLSGIAAASTSGTLLGTYIKIRLRNLNKILVRIRTFATTPLWTSAYSCNDLFLANGNVNAATYIHISISDPRTFIYRVIFSFLVPFYCCNLHHNGES